jgi:hypothetical protein
MSRRTITQEYAHRREVARGRRWLIDVTGGDAQEIAGQFVELFGRRGARRLLRRVREAIPEWRTVYDPDSRTFETVDDEDDAA